MEPVAASLKTKTLNDKPYVKDKDLKKLCADLRVVYQSPNREMAAVALQSFGEKWDAAYPEVRKKWEDA